MRVCTVACMCVCACLFLYVCINLLFKCLCACGPLYVFYYICMCVCVCVCARARCVCVYVFGCVYVFISCVYNILIFSVMYTHCVAIYFCCATSSIDFLKESFSSSHSNGTLLIFLHMSLSNSL